MVYKFFDKKTGSEASVHEQLTQKLHKPVINKLKRLVYASFKDNIRAIDFPEIDSLSSFNRGVKYLFEKGVFLKQFFMVLLN